MQHNSASPGTPGSLYWIAKQAIKPHKQLKQNGSYQIKHLDKYLDSIPQQHFILPHPPWNDLKYIFLTSKQYILLKLPEYMHRFESLH